VGRDDAVAVVQLIIWQNRKANKSFIRIFNWVDCLWLMTWFLLMHRWWIRAIGERGDWKHNLSHPLQSNNQQWTSLDTQQTWFEEFDSTPANKEVVVAATQKEIRCWVEKREGGGSWIERDLMHSIKQQMTQALLVLTDATNKVESSIQWMNLEVLVGAALLKWPKYF
jgi:hypothetical protein